MVEKNPDLFEIAFSDYFFNNKKDAVLVTLNNKGDDEIVPVSYFFREYDEFPELEKMALKYCFGKVLDIGAGSGSHSLVLQSNRIDVTALDIRSSFVEIMRKRGVENVIHADIYTFEEIKFDTLLMLMNGIGITGDLNGLKKFLIHAKKILKQSGQIILDSTDLMYIYTEENGSYKFNLDDDYYGEVLYRVEYEGMKGDSFKWLFVDFYTLSEIADSLEYNCELLFESENHNFLAKLQLT